MCPGLSAAAHGRAASSPEAQTHRRTAHRDAASLTRGVAQPCISSLHRSSSRINVVHCGIGADGFQGTEAHEGDVALGAIPAADT